MRFYRVVYYNSQKRTVCDWFLSKREARAEARKFLRAFHADPDASIKVQAVDIPATRQGVRAALQKFASHNDNEIAPDDPGKPHAIRSPA